MNPEGVS